MAFKGFEREGIFYLNIDMISCLENGYIPSHSTTCILLSSGQEFHVEGSLAEIANKIGIVI